MTRTPDSIIAEMRKHGSNQLTWRMRNGVEIAVMEVAGGGVKWTVNNRPASKYDIECVLYDLEHGARIRSER